MVLSVTMLYNWVILTFEGLLSVLVKVKEENLSESYRAVLCCGSVYDAVQGGSNF